VSEVRFLTRVLPDGWVSLTEHVPQWTGRDVVVTVEPAFPRRSNDQNRWYRGVIVPAVAGELSKGRDLPLSNDQAHHVLKAAFLGVEQTALGPAPRRSRTLTTAEFADYCERIRAHAASEWGLNIPSPNEPEPVGGWAQ